MRSWCHSSMMGSAGSADAIFAEDRHRCHFPIGVSEKRSRLSAQSTVDATRKGTP